MKKLISGSRRWIRGASYAGPGRHPIPLIAWLLGWVYMSVVLDIVGFVLGLFSLKGAGT